MRNPTFTFDFEELPVHFECGFEAGRMDGAAEISYNRDGEWNIETISLDATKRNRWTVEDYWAAHQTGKTLPAYERKLVTLDEGTPLYMMIYDCLETRWKDRVETAVLEQIASDREDAAQYRAEARREDRMLGAGQ